MRHTPYGYEIVDGKVVVNKEQAAVIRSVCKNYLSGMSLIKAGEQAGLNLKNAGVKLLMQNPRYLGDENYPAILDEDTFNRVAVELKRRATARGRDNLPKKPFPEAVICMSFTIPRVPQIYSNAVEQAEYAYSLIECKEGD